MNNMSLFDATMIAEGAVNPESEEQYIQAWQLLIDTGQCWRLQGWFGRMAMKMIDAGLCTVEEDNTENNNVDPEYCDCCECTPCDCDWGNHEN